MFYLHEDVSFRNRKHVPIGGLKPFQSSHDIYLAKMPKEYSIDDDTEDINCEPKADIVEIDIDISDRILKLPDSQLDVS